MPICGGKYKYVVKESKVCGTVTFYGFITVCVCTHIEKGKSFCVNKCEMIGYRCSE